MRIFKSRPFSRFARQNQIIDDDLCEAIAQAERGLIDADLGGGVIKQRIARPNEGKSGGFRTIVVFRLEDRSVFVYGFPKNERGNIRQDELKTFKRLADELLALDDVQIQSVVDAGSYMEVICDEENL